MSNVLRYDQTHDAYIMECSYDDRQLPKDAEFTWNKLVPGKWATKDKAKAAKLLRYATTDARQRLEVVAQQRQAAIEMSRASSASSLSGTVAVRVEALAEPEDLSYLPYQKVGIQWALDRQGSLIGDEMGLGKTIQAIGVINNDESIKRVLIVCPKSLKLNWAKELTKWLTRDLSIGIVNPGKDIPDADILIVNYDILYRYDFNEHEWDLVVGDEIHFCKNAKTRRGKAFYELDGRRRIGLTGTPIVNRPAELFPIIHWLDPVTWDNFFKYAKRYCDATQGRHGWDFSGASNLPQLQEELRASVMVRRKKVDVLKELPRKRRSIVVIPSNGAAKIIEAELAAYRRHQERLAEAMAERDLAEAGEDSEGYKAAVAKLFAINSIMLQEISSHRAEVALAKAPHVAEHVQNILEDNDGYKVVVFAHHKAVVDLLMMELKQYNPVKVTGDVSATNRQAAVERFQSDPACQVFVGNIQAAGVGLTLTASAHVVMGELDWVPGNVSQAEDRCHRIGQEESVLIEHLVFDNSLDAKMAKTIVNKQEIIDSALDDTVDPAEMVVLEEDTSTRSVTAKAVKAIKQLTADQVAAVQEALRILAGTDTDHAATRNDVGFNRYDTKVGHDLAMRPTLSDKQAALAYRVVSKYHRQLPSRLMDVLKGAIA